MIIRQQMFLVLAFYYMKEHNFRCYPDSFSYSNWFILSDQTYLEIFKLKMDEQHIKMDDLTMISSNRHSFLEMGLL